MLLAIAEELMGFVLLLGPMIKLILLLTNSRMRATQISNEEHFFTQFSGRRRSQFRAIIFLSLKLEIVEQFNSKSLKTPIVYKV